MKMPKSTDHNLPFLANPSGEEIAAPPPHFDNPFLDFLVVEQCGIGEGWARTAIEQRDQLNNMHGAVHGGVLMALLDTTMARAAMAKQHYRFSVVSTGVTVNFLSPAKGKLYAEASAVGGGLSTCFCEAKIWDASGMLIAQGMGTFKYKKPPGEGGQSLVQSVE